MQGPGRIFCWEARRPAVGLRGKTREREWVLDFGLGAAGGRAAGSTTQRGGRVGGFGFLVDALSSNRRYSNCNI